MARSHQIGYEGEVKVAKFLNLHRGGASAAAKGETDLYSKDNILKVEVKAGKQIPKLIIKAMSQAVKNSNEANQMPIVVMVPKGVGDAKVGEKAIAMVRLCDMKRLLELGNFKIEQPKEVAVTMASGEIFTYN